MTTDQQQRVILVEGSWLVIDLPDNPTIRLDAKLLDRILAADDQLALTVGDLTPMLEVPDGPLAAAEIANTLAPYTRSAQIASVEVYRDAKRRLELASRGRYDNGALSLYFGKDDVFISDEVVRIGRDRFTVSEVTAYAGSESNLELSRGLLQAGLVMLVVAATKRREDIGLLSRRVAEFEQRTAVSPPKKESG